MICIHTQKIDDLQEVLKTAADRVVHAMKEAKEVVPAIELDSAKDNIVFQLVNTEQNKEMLQNMPNSDYPRRQ